MQCDSAFCITWQYLELAIHENLSAEYLKGRENKTTSWFVQFWFQSV